MKMQINYSDSLIFCTVILDPTEEDGSSILLKLEEWDFAWFPIEVWCIGLSLSRESVEEVAEITPK